MPEACGKVTHLVVHDDVCVACGRIGQGGKQAIPFSGLVPSYLRFYFDLIRYKGSLLGMTKVQSQTYHS